MSEKVLADPNLICKLKYNDLKAQNIHVPYLLYMRLEVELETDSKFIATNFCVINSHRLVVSDFCNRKVRLYDDNFKLLNSIGKEINGKSVHVSEITTNSIDKIYIKDGSLVHVCDLELNHLRSVNLVLPNYLITHGFALHYSNNYLYACDEKIHIF